VLRREKSLWFTQTILTQESSQASLVAMLFLTHTRRVFVWDELRLVLVGKTPIFTSMKREHECPPSLACTRNLGSLQISPPYRHYKHRFRRFFGLFFVCECLCCLPLFSFSSGLGGEWITHYGFQKGWGFSRLCFYNWLDCLTLL